MTAALRARVALRPPVAGTRSLSHWERVPAKGGRGSGLSVALESARLGMRRKG
jgi:hypothetical protein